MIIGDSSINNHVLLAADLYIFSQALQMKSEARDSLIMKNLYEYESLLSYFPLTQVDFEYDLGRQPLPLSTFLVGGSKYTSEQDKSLIVPPGFYPSPTGT